MSNKVSEIIRLRKQVRPKTTSKEEKIRLYPKIWNLMQQLSQREWEHPIIQDLNKFFTTTTGGKWYVKKAERFVAPSQTPARSQRSGPNPYLKNAPKQAVGRNARKVQDGRFMDGSRDWAHITLNGRKVTVTGNHLEETPSERSNQRGAHGWKAARNVMDAQGNLVRQQAGRKNYGLDYTPHEREKYNQQKHKYWEGKKDRDGKKYRIPLRSPVAGRVIHIEEKRKPSL